MIFAHCVTGPSWPLQRRVTRSGRNNRPPDGNCDSIGEHRIRVCGRADDGENGRGCGGGDGEGEQGLADSRRRTRCRGRRLRSAAGTNQDRRETLRRYAMMSAFSVDWHAHYCRTDRLTPVNFIDVEMVIAMIYAITCDRKIDLLAGGTAASETCPIGHLSSPGRQIFYEI